MGRLLQIRVMAQTFRPEDVQKAWPRLCRLAWPQDHPDQGASGGPAKGERGVLELVQTLTDQVSFGDLPKDLARALEPSVRRVYEIMESLEAALADWKPAEANMASDRLEAALDDLEKEAPKD